MEFYFNVDCLVILSPSSVRAGTCAEGSGRGRRAIPEQVPRKEGRVKSLLMVLILVCGSCWAQTLDDSKPSSSNVMGAGSAELNGIGASVVSFRDALQKSGIKVVYYESPGTAHEWLTWRRDLNEFAPLLFR